MPEIGEVARIVHYLRKHLVNRTIKSCQGFEDDIVYGKVGCSASAFTKAVEGKKVTGAGQQGKYFYVTFDSPPHSVMHLGMTGWIKFSTEETGYYKQAKVSPKVEDWPPKYMKFLLKCEAEKVEGEDREPVEVAFVDARRLARIRLVDCDADNIRDHTPLKENGPDPIVDKEKFTVEFLTALLRRKKVPVKALLLDQANISGVGNWVADEVLYQAKLHPEQYSNTFEDDQIRRLHESLVYVCSIAVETLADSEQFPKTWLMKYRWDKGKKTGGTLPSGEAIKFLTVGGRTSAIVPSVQKKTSAVAGDVDEADDNGKEKRSAKGRKRKSKADEEDDAADEEEQEDEEEEETMPAKRDRTKRIKTEPLVDTPPKQKGGRGKKAKVEPIDEGEPEEGEPEPVQGKISKDSQKREKKSIAPGSRRSTRSKAK